MVFKKLLSLCICFEYNFRILHWKVTGINFDSYHSLMASFYEKFSEFVDILSETSISIGEQPISMIEAYRTLETYEEEYLILDAGQSFSESETIDFSNEMLETILREIIELRSKDVIKSNYAINAKLDSICEWIDLELNYKNKMRK